MVVLRGDGPDGVSGFPADPTRGNGSVRGGLSGRWLFDMFEGYGPRTAVVVAGNALWVVARSPLVIDALDG